LVVLVVLAASMVVHINMGAAARVVLVTVQEEAVAVVQEEAVQEEAAEAVVPLDGVKRTLRPMVLMAVSVVPEASVAVAL
jgi:hypothetical protein